MDLSTTGIVRSLERVGLTVQNALEVARFGGLDTGEEPAPFDVVAEHPVYRLRHYPGIGRTARKRPTVLLVPPLMIRADVYDVSPQTSAVRTLDANGIDAWVVDFGAPEQEEGGLDRTLTDHVLAVDDAIEEVARATGRSVHLCGYSQGGMFCYQVAAYRRGRDIASLVTFGTPVDTREMIPFGLPEEAVLSLAGFLADNVLARASIPGWLSRTGFRLLDPVKYVRNRGDFVRQLHNRESLLPREGQRRFLEVDGWVAWPGPALAEMMQQFVAANRMLSGGFVIDGVAATLADIELPILSFAGTVDEIAPHSSVRAIARAAPRADVWSVEQRVGHFGLVVGTASDEVTWPTVAAWARWREGLGPRPAAVHQLDLTSEADDGAEPGAADRAAFLAGLTADVAASIAKGTANAARRTGDAVRRAVVGGAEQIVRLNRLERSGPAALISLARVLDEQAKDNPDAIFFLFADRAYTHADLKRRVDNIVRGLIAVGVRRGEHVGVLMDTRPSALAVVCALNRLGAVVVLVRPDGAPRLEVELGRVRRLITDPEHAEIAAGTGADQVLVLGGGGEPRELGFGLTDLERIDPDAVALPGWYKPNPGRGRDLAFILFTGNRGSLRANHITNRRWALSAFGTASAAALGRTDTVFGVTPLHHPSGLLTSIGGAVAGGARLALGSDSTAFGPGFWSEVRRYGATIVPYTWTSLRPLLALPPSPAEQHHPVRLFVGSGMPPGLWRRVQERFAPAHVLEFYASTEGEAVLANLSGEKVGAKGRPLPGSAAPVIVRYDVENRTLVTGPDGFAVRCGRGEVGMLIARADREQGGLLGEPLRGVFHGDDAWQVTGDLFTRDDDDVLWLVDHVDRMVPTRSGMVPSLPVADALGLVEGVDLATAYGVSDGKGHEVLVAAVTLQAGARLDARAVTGGLARFTGDGRPAAVRVVGDLPVTTWGRPVTSPLRAEGIPEPTAARPVFKWNARASAYKAAAPRKA